MKLKLERITHYDNDKDGKPLVTRNGKPYTRCVIQTTDKRYSGFGSQTTRGWKEGDEVEVEVTQNGNYLNFKVPDQRVTKFDLLALETRVQALERFMQDSLADKQPEPTIEEQIDEVFPPEENVA